ncbi:hypothetical protein DL98DRAFT_643329 [Cadophora sp. DSE1049]|nr:hypothetical protein DL98DRAFT_643329 [Cadophora sp. DSE1049]
MTKGGTDEKDLNEALSQLDRAKGELGLRIQLANVGVTRSLRDGMVATMPVIQRTNANVTRVLGAGLPIAKLLEDSTPKSRYGEVLLEEDEIETLGLAGPNTGANELAWSGNETFDQSKQLNEPAGEKIWQSGSKMTWEKNISRGESKQINGPVNDEVLKSFFA